MIGRERPSKPNDGAVTLHLENPDGVRPKMFLNLEDITVLPHGVVVNVASSSAMFFPWHRISSIEGTAVAVRMVTHVTELSP